MARRALPVLTLLLAVAPLGGCGDDSPTTTQLHARATAICARAAVAMDRIAVPSVPAQGDRFLEQGLAELRPAVARLRALTPPDELRERYDRALRLADHEVVLIERHARAIARDRDVIDTYRRLDRALTPLVREENAAWRGLGVPACMRR